MYAATAWFKQLEPYGCMLRRLKQFALLGKAASVELMILHDTPELINISAGSSAVITVTMPECGVIVYTYSSALLSLGSDGLVNRILSFIL